MLEARLTEARQNFAAVYETALRRRVLNAQPVRLLSDRDDKLLELVQDQQGDLFVRRSYGRSALRKIEAESGLSFSHAWKEMHSIFGVAGIDIVPSYVLRPTSQESSYPVVVVSKYLPSGSIHSASTETKTKLATGLGSILMNSGRYVPSLEAFTSDMFMVERNAQGKETLLLVDIDPYLASRSWITSGTEGKDMWFGAYIDGLASKFWDKWCRPDERAQVMSAFVRQVAPAIEQFKAGDGANTLNALAAANAMTQGFDLRF